MIHGHGGNIYYGGILIDKPSIGVNFKAVRQPDIQKACALIDAKRNFYCGGPCLGRGHFSIRLISNQIFLIDL